jgi:imidazolonepropionase-like amidohydrolase
MLETVKGIDCNMKTLFVNGIVFDGCKKLDQNHAVLIEDDKIVEIAPIGKFKGFSGKKIDLTGHTLLPGLIDCHVHLIFSGQPSLQHTADTKSDAEIVLDALNNAQKCLEGGITSIRDCGGKNFLEFAVRDACASGQFVGPTIRAAGQPICMTGGHCYFIAREADGANEVIKAVREQIHAGCDHIKIMATGGVTTDGVNPEDSHYNHEEIAAGIREARRFNKPSASHAQGAEGIINAVKAGVSSIEHGIFLNEESITSMVNNGTYLVPTLAAINGIVNGKDVPQFMIDKTSKFVERHQQSIKNFYDAGGKLVMGTDAGTPFNFHGKNAIELKYMHDLGITATDCLIAATKNGADLMRLEHCGQISAGMNADILVVEGDATTDITAAADVNNHRIVYKNGQVIMDQLKKNTELALAA